MCLNCGCMIPNDDHGNPDNITVDNQVKKAADASNDGDVVAALDMIEKTSQKAKDDLTE